mgnify:CR=1 FL=1
MSGRRPSRPDLRGPAYLAVLRRLEGQVDADADAWVRPVSQAPAPVRRSGGCSRGLRDWGAAALRRLRGRA